MRRIETGFRHNAWRITTTPTSWAEGRKEKIQSTIKRPYTILECRLKLLQSISRPPSANMKQY
jgi:hypothetical protein